MDFQAVVFYFLATVVVLASLRVITAKNPVHAALFLVLAFFSAGGIWMLLHAEFLAIALVMVYVGAVMVLFLFVVMMLDINLERIRQGFWSYLPIGALIGIVIGLALCLLQQELGIIKLGQAAGSFIIDAYPVRVEAGDILIVFITVLSIGFLAAWYPVHYLGKKWLAR